MLKELVTMELTYLPEVPVITPEDARLPAISGELYSARYCPLTDGYLFCSHSSEGFTFSSVESLVAYIDLDITKPYTPSGAKTTKMLKKALLAFSGKHQLATIERILAALGERWDKKPTPITAIISWDPQEILQVGNRTEEELGKSSCFSEGGQYHYHPEKWAFLSKDACVIWLYANDKAVARCLAILPKPDDRNPETDFAFSGNRYYSHIRERREYFFEAIGAYLGHPVKMTKMGLSAGLQYVYCNGDWWSTPHLPVDLTYATEDDTCETCDSADCQCWICDDCDDMYAPDDCHYVVHRDVHSHHDRLVCTSCFEDYYAPCDACEVFILHGNLINGLCANCVSVSEEEAEKEEPTHDNTVLVADATT